MCECVSEDMSPYCSAHDEWLIMKLCMYVGYHDANNVSNFGGDAVTKLKLFKKRLTNLICHFLFQNMRSAGYHEKMIGRTYFGGEPVYPIKFSFEQYHRMAIPA